MNRCGYGGLAVVALAVLASACGPAASPGGPEASIVGGRPTAVKRITGAIRGDPRTLSDAVNSAGGGSTAGVAEVEQLLNSGLGVIDNDGRIRPQLAGAVPSIENGLWKLFPDGRMETTWKLRQGVLWHDGAPFSADDLVFSVRVAQDRQVAIAQDRAFRFIDTAEASDPYTLVVTWKQPFIDADRVLSHVDNSHILPMPRHILEPPYLEDSAALVQHSYFTQGYIGTGPFRLRDWILGSHLILEANDRYPLGRPKVDVVEVKFLLDTNVIVANVISGAVDVTLGRGLTLEQAILARNQWREGRVETALVNFTALWPQFINPNPPVVADVRFRRALIHALDRQQIVDTFLGGLAPVADGVITPDQPEYRDIQASIVRYEYDPRRSPEIIEGLGYTRGADGIFRDPAGGKLSVQISTRTHDLREKLLPVIGDSWARVGVEVEPEVIPEQRASDTAYRAQFPGFRFQFNPPDPTRFHSSTTPLPENNFRGNNYARYRSPELDGLLDRYVVTIPKNERVQVLAQIVNHMTSQLVPMTLFYDSDPTMISNRLVNVFGRKGEGVQGWNAHEWDVRSVTGDKGQGTG